MKKSIIIFVLVIVTVFCICFGSYKHLAGFKSVFKDGSLNITFDDVDNDYDNEDEELSNLGKYEIDRKLEKFSSIRIDAAVMGITIEEGDDFKIEGSFNREILKPEISIKNGQLNVIQGKRKSHGINMGSQNCRMVITIPSGNSLSTIDINSNVGDIRLREITADEIDVDLNVGEIDIRKVDFIECDCDNNVGEISIIPLSSLNDYDISAKTDVGEVRVDGRSHKKSYSARGNGKNKIKANTNVGEINIK